MIEFEIRNRTDLALSVYVDISRIFLDFFGIYIKSTTHAFLSYFHRVLCVNSLCSQGRENTFRWSSNHFHECQGCKKSVSISGTSGKGKQSDLRGRTAYFLYIPIHFWGEICDLFLLGWGEAKYILLPLQGLGRSGTGLSIS